MARILGQFPAALIAARHGWTGTQFIKHLRSIGEGARDSEVRKLLNLAYETLAKSPNEPFQPLELVPDLSQAEPWASITATGVSQAVELTYRDRATGTLVTVPYQVHSENGVTRAEAISAAIDAYRRKAEDYEQDLVGAVHTKTFKYLPTFTTDE